MSEAPEPNPSTTAPSRQIYHPARRCDCENRLCQAGHVLGDCKNNGTIKAVEGYLCEDCAEFMPAEYLLGDRLLHHTPEPWAGLPSRSDHSILIMRDPLKSSNDVIACVMYHRDGTTPANAKLLQAAPRLLRELRKLHGVCQALTCSQVITVEKSKEIVTAIVDAGELLREMEVRP